MIFRSKDLRTFKAYKLDFQKHMPCKYKKTPCHPDYSKNTEAENTSSAYSLSFSNFKYHTSHINMALIILKVKPKVKNKCSSVSFEIYTVLKADNVVTFLMLDEVLSLDFSRTGFHLRICNIEILKNYLDIFILQGKKNVHSLNEENCQFECQKSCFPCFKVLWFSSVGC